jgi:uncharacterized damage-inducible protein DinB
MIRIRRTFSISLPETGGIQVEPKLAPPGAGLPKLELMIARTLFAWRLATGSRAKFDAEFRREREAVRKLYQQCDPQQGAERVLIKRPVGLEDSSRNWSVWMTLDHLRIVHTSITGVVGALAKGIVPDGKADTAAVKPSTDAATDIVAAYERSCDKLSEQFATTPDLNTKARYPHPWFGPLNAAGWHALSGRHLAIHRVQLERILAGLKS